MCFAGKLWDLDGFSVFCQLTLTHFEAVTCATDVIIDELELVLCKFFFVIVLLTL